MASRLSDFPLSEFSCAVKYVLFIFILMPHAVSNFDFFLLKCDCHFSITEDENFSSNTAPVLCDLS